jgi:hypothetical protein
MVSFADLLNHRPAALRLSHIVRRCGHEETVETPNEKDLGYLAFQESRDCLECYKLENSRLDIEAVAAGMRCELQGSEKQVSWSQGLRQKRWNELDATMHALSERGATYVHAGDITAAEQNETIGLMFDVCSAIFEGTQSPTGHTERAKWWIEQRDLSVADVLQQFFPDRKLSGTDARSFFRRVAVQPESPGAWGKKNASLDW